MRAVDKQRAIQLRTEKHMGYGEIVRLLGVPKSTLSVWLRDYPLSEARVQELRRAAWSRGEAKREQFRTTMRAKRDEREQRVYEQQRAKIGEVSSQTDFVAGLMLYAAEGDKKNRSTIALANTDPTLIRFFIRWLHEHLAIPREKMRVELHLYESMDIEAEKAYWRDITGLSQDQFYRSQIRQLRPNSFSYSESFRHGTCRVLTHGVEAKTELLLSIRAFLGTYRGL